MRTLVGSVFVWLCAMAAPALAFVVCNNGGRDCWHTDMHYDYPNSDFEIHPDDWYFHQEWGTQHRWHGTQDAPAYWRNGGWITF